MGEFWTLLVRLFGKMAGFIKFEADDVNGDVIDNCDQAAQTVSDKEFIDDETQIDDNMEDYYAFTNACRSVELQCRTLFSSRIAENLSMR